MRLAAVLLLVAAPALAEVPAMGSDETCAQVAQDVGDPNLLPRCLADEAGALARLEGGWDAVPLDVAGGCAAAAADGNPGSYQILLICVEGALADAGQPSPFPEAP